MRDNEPGRPPIEFLSLDQCLAMRQGYLVTVNMQHLYEARRSTVAAAAIFGSAGARYCLDGRGAAGLFRRVTTGPLPLVQGNVLLDHWLRGAEGKRLLVIGSSAAVIERALAGYPQLEASVDARHVSIRSASEAEAWAAELSSRYPGQWDLVAIALGVPKQELLASALQRKIAAPIYCIGGSFEMLADVLPRSPKLIQVTGLEAVWRLLLEPSSKRIDRLLRSYGMFAALRVRRPSLRSLTGRLD